MIHTKCEWCGNPIHRGGFKPGRFCSTKCKGEWQRTQKPVDRDWLYQKYVTEKQSTYDIAKIVKRDPKRVHEWLVDLNIPTRQRGWKTEPDPSQHHQNADWLRREYLDKNRSASDIAKECGVTDNNILYFLSKFHIKTRDMSTIRKQKHWGLAGIVNGMFGKCGAQSPSWKGGVTPERQAFYSSAGWKRAARKVGARDKGICQRCGKSCKGERDSHIHHIVSFANKALRASPDNLVTLCNSCHKFVHSKANTSREFIR